MQNTVEVATSCTDPATVRLERRRQRAAKRGSQQTEPGTPIEPKAVPTRRTPAGWNFLLCGDPIGIPVAG